MFKALVTLTLIAGIVSLSLIINQTLAYDKAYSKVALSNTTQLLIDNCAVIFDTGDTTSKASHFCENMMTIIDKECQNNYHKYCFGVAWSNYDFNHRSETN